MLKIKLLDCKGTVIRSVIDLKGAYKLIMFLPKAGLLRARLAYNLVLEAGGDEQIIGDIQQNMKDVLQQIQDNESEESVQSDNHHDIDSVQFSGRMQSAATYVHEQKESDSTHVNFIYATKTPAFPGWIKIGKAVNVKQRLSSLNTGCAVAKHVLVASVPSLDYTRDEKDAHAFFSHVERIGEFFSVSDEEVIDYFEKINQRFQEEISAWKSASFSSLGNDSKQNMDEVASANDDVKTPMDEDQASTGDDSHAASGLEEEEEYDDLLDEMSDGQSSMQSMIVETNNDKLLTGIPMAQSLHLVVNGKQITVRRVDVSGLGPLMLTYDVIAEFSNSSRETAGKFFRNLPVEKMNEVMHSLPFLPTFTFPKFSFIFPDFLSGNLGRLLGKATKILTFIFPYSPLSFLIFCQERFSPILFHFCALI